MRVPLKGINRVTYKRADGTLTTYYYAWKGGPRLEGKPGSPEFHASYNAAVARRSARPRDQLASIFAAYRASPEFTTLAPRTRHGYQGHLNTIGDMFGDMPIAALTDRRTRAAMLEWRDRMAERSPRSADYCFTVLARALAWALDRGLVPVNPAKRPGKTYRGSRAERIWTEADEAKFMAAAPKPMRMAMMLALWTGQRQGDLLALTWAQYDGACIRLVQSKTGARVMIPIAGPLRAILDEEKSATQNRAQIVSALPILTNLRGQKWTGDGFRTSWRKICQRAGIEGLTFHDLRGTAVTRLAMAGCSVAEIATITGHSLQGAETILNAHYLSRDPALARSAMAKLESFRKFPNVSQLSGDGE